MSFGDFATSSSSSSSTRGSVGGGSVARGSFGGVGATTSYQGIGADAEHERLLYVVTQNVQVNKETRSKQQPEEESRRSYVCVLIFCANSLFV
jgi:hypothetical protein